MSTHVKRLMVMLALLAGILPAGAQTIILRNSFVFGSLQTSLVQASDGNLYGTTFNGGADFSGSVFRITPNGVLTTLYSFTDGNDGADPNTLVQANDGNFYGTTSGAGADHDGTVFRITTNGVLTTLYTFTGGHDGGDCYGSLVQASDGNLYGTASYGGTNNFGTIFRITTNGVFTPLYSFTDHLDGGYPDVGLVQAVDGNLYGTAYYGGNTGGTSTNGTIYRISLSGAFTNVYAFTNGHDGSAPQAPLVQARDGNLYGTAGSGGTNGWGTVFRITTTGVMTPLYSFTGGHDGAIPYGGLIQASDGYLYGTAYQGGTNGDGTIFRISTGGAFTAFLSLNGGNGRGPTAALMQSKAGNFYGTTYQGGANNGGAVFEVAYPLPVFSILHDTNQSFFYWPGTNINYALRSVTNLLSTNWVAAGNSAPAVAVFATVTNSSPRQYFQLENNQGLLTRYSFTGGNNGNQPRAAVMQASDGNFYGTTSLGGSNNDGTVFRVTTSGAFSSLYSFTNGHDGSDPVAGLVQANDGNLYGTTSSGGTKKFGTIFRITTNGVFTVLYTNTSGETGVPQSGLVVASDGNLYGENYWGSSGNGSIFRITTNGTYTTLYSLNGVGDGQNPNGGLVQAGDGNLYGVTYEAGSLAANGGTVFRISLSGVYTVLLAFGGGSDGDNPQGNLVLASDGNLYGTTSEGGNNGAGTVFRITTSGVFTPLYSFSAGDFDYAGLVQAGDGNLYGTISAGYGALFRITTNGTFTQIYSFSGGNDGNGPDSDLIVGSDGNLYGTTLTGGNDADGNVFEMYLTPPALTVLPAGNQSILSWPGYNTNYIYVLQSSNAVSPTWANVSNAMPAVVSATTITNSLPAQFFRLLNF